MTYENNEPRGNYRPNQTQQRNSPPAVKGVQYVQRQRSHPHGRASYGAQQTPEPGLRYLSDVRRRRTRAEPGTESHQQRRHAQGGRRVRVVY